VNWNQIASAAFAFGGKKPKKKTSGKIATSFGATGKMGGLTIGGQKLIMALKAAKKAKKDAMEEEG